MNALIPTVEAAHAAPAELTQVDRKVSANDWKFLQAYLESIEGEGKADYAAIGRKLSISRQAVWKRMQDEKFASWVNQEIRRTTDAMWGAICYRAGVLAVKGSIDHMTFVAKVRGEFRQPDGPPPGGAVPVQVNILIPRPRR